MLLEIHINWEGFPLHYLTSKTSTNFQAGIYFFKVNDGDIKAMWEICPNLTINTPERRQHRSGVFNFEQIPYMVLMLPLFTLT